MPILQPRLMNPKYITNSDIIYQLSHQNDDLRPMVRVVASLFFALTPIALAMRFVAQRRIGARRLRIDDTLILISEFLLLGEYIAAMYGTTTGYGRHAVLVTSDKKWHRNSYVGYMQFTLYTFSMGFLKISVLFLYRRLFGVRKSIRIASLVVGAFVVAQSLAIVLSNTIICPPSQYLSFQAKCLKLTSILSCGTILNLVSDIFVLAIPLQAIHQLHLPFRQRLAIAGIFAASGASVVVTGVRIYYMKFFSLYSDPTYINAKSLTMCIVEIAVGIICACIPLMQPLFRAWFPSRTRTNNSSNNPGFKFSDGPNSNSQNSGSRRIGGSQQVLGSPSQPTRMDRFWSKMDSLTGSKQWGNTFGTNSLGPNTFFWDKNLTSITASEPEPEPKREPSPEVKPAPEVQERELKFAGSPASMSSIDKPLPATPPYTGIDSSIIHERDLPQRPERVEVRERMVGTDWGEAVLITEEKI